MNGRSWLVTFFIFLFLLLIIVFQVLSMVQADRLYERLNQLLERLSRAGSVRVAQEKAKRADLPGEEYPGDDGDWLVFHIIAEPATLNPITRKDIYASYIVGDEFGNVFESFLKYNLDAIELEPLLAESYEISENGLELTFNLRDDAYFSDGKKITTDDVIFSYQTIINPKVDAHALANYYRDIKEVIRINDRTVKFVMRQPYYKSVEVAGGMPILPKHIYEFDDPSEFNEHRSNPIGSGPYVFEKWDVGQQIVLRRNENYWGPKPKLKKLIFRIITNEIAALQALRSHEIDFIEPASEQFVELSENKEFIEEFRCISYWSPTEGYSYVGWNQLLPFFADRKVRLAMTHLIDREGIIRGIYKGLGRVVTGPFYFLGPQNNPGIEPWPYDPAKAMKLLNEAGWIDTDADGIRDKDGVLFRFKMMIPSGSPIYERLARLIKDSMAKAGIEMIIDPYEWSVFEERLNQRNFDAIMLGWGGVVQSDPYQIWHSSQIAGRGSNRIGFANDEADTLIEEARRTMDVEKRNKLYHKFHEILHFEQPYTFFRARPAIRFLDKRFENVKIHKIGLDIHEWYVPKEKQRYK